MNERCRRAASREESGGTVDLAPGESVADDDFCAACSAAAIKETQRWVSHTLPQRRQRFISSEPRISSGPRTGFSSRGLLRGERWPREVDFSTEGQELPGRG